MRCLWLAREIPFPVNTGDRAYSGKLAAAFSQAGIEVHFLGLASSAQVDTGADKKVHWIPVIGTRKCYGIALFSNLPFVAAAHATTAHRQALARLLEQKWDVIVLDNYGAGWALPTVSKLIRNSAKSAQRPVLVHIAHNHEESLSHSLFRGYRGSVLKRLALYQNHLKIRYLERTLVRKADIVTAITAEDRDAFSRYTAKQKLLVLPPGFSGWAAPPRCIDGDTPRRIVLLGSFQWVVKAENLRRVVQQMDPLLHRHGIVLDVVGAVPDYLLDELRPIARATRFHGFVADVSTYMQSARMALVPEVIGGGFKLKLLDYIFGRVPVASLADAAAGLPATIQNNMLTAQTLEDLTQKIVASIDDATLLNQMQTQAAEAAASLFDWHDRGADLKHAVNNIASIRAYLGNNGAAILQNGGQA